MKLLGLFTPFFYLSLFLGNVWADNRPELMLANVYSSQDHKTNLNHYWVSEKYDGVRAYWNGKHLLSRQGFIYQAPDWFIQHLPKYPLDGELWLGRGKFDQLSGIVRTQIPSNEDWGLVRFMVFDIPNHIGRFDQRLQELNTLHDSRTLPPWVEVVKQWKVESEAALLRQLDELVNQGAEGLMLHDGRSMYSATRSDDLIKLKPSMDSEGIVLSYVEGKGKYQGKVGAIWVKASIVDSEGITRMKTFKIGSGFTDKERENPPPIGSEITFKYSGLTSTGLPRFVRYWRMRKR